RREHAVGLIYRVHRISGSEVRFNDVLSTRISSDLATGGDGERLAPNDLERSGLRIANEPRDARRRRGVDDVKKTIERIRGDRPRGRDASAVRVRTAGESHETAGVAVDDKAVRVR